MSTRSRPAAAGTARTAPDERTTAFEDLVIAWDPRILEPRPWTAAQSRWAADGADVAPPGPVLELCAGAGHIGLLAARLTGRDLVQVDLDPVALAYAERNAAAAGVRTETRCADVAAAVGADERYGVVVADPPWVPSAEVGRFPDDPVRAIDGGEDGGALADACLRVGAAHLAPGGHLVLQVGTQQQLGRLVRTHCSGSLRFAGSRVFPRGVLGRFVAV